MAANKKQIEELKDILLQRKANMIQYIQTSRSNIDELKSQECKDDLD